MFGIKKQIQSLIDTINSAMNMKTPEYIGVLGVFKEKHVDNIIDTCLSILDAYEQ